MTRDKIRNASIVEYHHAVGDQEGRILKMSRVRYQCGCVISEIEAYISANSRCKQVYSRSIYVKL